MLYSSVILTIPISKAIDVIGNKSNRRSFENLKEFRFSFDVIFEIKYVVKNSNIFELEL